MFRSHTTSAFLVASLALTAHSAVLAQDSDSTSDDDDTLEEVVVIGSRDTIQRSIELKRNATQIVDGLSSQEIGDIPALSIGAALETITGATA
ncbi:MAG: hypothetical protein AAF917_13350, partial [Pseudomonadota bacterium]